MYVYMFVGLVDGQPGGKVVYILYHALSSVLFVNKGQVDAKQCI